MKKTSILNFFKVQTPCPKTCCPSCGTQVPETQIDIHLNSSSCNKFKSLSNNDSIKCTTTSQNKKLQTKRQISNSSTKLSLKGRKKQKTCPSRKAERNISEVSSEDDVVVLEEIKRTVYLPKKASTPNKIDVDCCSPKKDIAPQSKNLSQLLNKRYQHKKYLNRNVKPNEREKIQLCDEQNLIRSTDFAHIKCTLEKASKTSDIPEDIAQDIDIAKDIEKAIFSDLSDNEKETEIKPHSSYYIANFNHILKVVLNDKHNDILFNEEDRKSIKSFETLSDSAKKLYVRLFQRKYRWLKIAKIKYPEISANINCVLDELASAALVDSGSESFELEASIDLLSLPEAKTLVKHFNLTLGKNKTEIKEMLLKHCKQHKSVFFTGGKNNISGLVLKKTKEIIGPCYRISLLPKRVFTRILMLFSLPTISEEDDDAAGGQQQQLLTLLQVNKGELVFPEYQQTKKTAIFSERDELIRYEEAKHLENSIFGLVENKKFEAAKELCIEAEETFENLFSSAMAKRAETLPSFLKRYTCMHVYVRCMTSGVEVYQKLRKYEEAVALLKKMLQQKVFCLDYHGFWYERLALNLEQHLKQPKLALDVIRDAFHDKSVRVGYKYSLMTRALKKVDSIEDENFKNMLLQEKESIIEAPKVTIEGTTSRRPILGRRNVFISSESADLVDDVRVVGVEEVALEHYRTQGYPEGLHGEGSTFISLYTLLFWDLIYDGSVPDVFISPYQTHPLDLNHQVFFENREKRILGHLEMLRSSSVEDLEEMIENTWTKQHGKSCLVSWDLFKDVEQAKGLVGCFCPVILCGICERLARDFRFTRSGVPDLVVWNPQNQKVKIVEVKGPGDKLSSKQILWLDHLIKLGADAEVCLVDAVMAKRLRKN